MIKSSNTYTFAINTVDSGRKKNKNHVNFEMNSSFSAIPFTPSHCCCFIFYFYHVFRYFYWSSGLLKSCHNKNEVISVHIYTYIRINTRKIFSFFLLHMHNHTLHFSTYTQAHTKIQINCDSLENRWTMNIEQLK